MDNFRQDKVIARNLRWAHLPPEMKTQLTALGVGWEEFNVYTAEEKMSTLARIGTTVVANDPITVKKDLPYFVIALEEGINTGTIQRVPQKAFQNIEEASRYAAQNTTRNRPLFVVKVVSKIEIAPPPTVVTNFDD